MRYFCVSSPAENGFFLFGKQRDQLLRRLCLRTAAHLSHSIFMQRIHRAVCLAYQALPHKQFEYAVTNKGKGQGTELTRIAVFL